jgi:solute carrier family 25 aspartate/glutamate transporter 12/13
MHSFDLHRRPDTLGGKGFGRTVLAKAGMQGCVEPFPALDMTGFIAGAKELVTGGVAGAVGSFLVFPIDLAKTRIQDQRAVAGAEVVYKNIVQTITKVVSTEGFPSLYKGVTPVLIGAAPEGALQIGVNNIVRQTFADQLKTTEDKIPLPYEVIAGGCGGAAQVVVSNPMERVKVLQQIMGKKASTVGQIVQQVGIRGLYTVCDNVRF